VQRSSRVEQGGGGVERIAHDIRDARKFSGTHTLFREGLEVFREFG
jgi:hypothetical protein